ncbi:MAG: iron-containing alcohol dehydrogenase [Deltaproteobacteria bacterium]|nr:iron-containing alcohol dehydrogenase [Deltaproteobacteria bacterium]
MTEIHNFYFPTTIRFGAGAIKLLRQELTQRRCKRPFIVTDRGVVAQPFFQTILNELKDFNPAVYSDVHPNPWLSDVTKGAKICREIEADCIVTVGGGSPMDTAKAIALMACVEGELFQYQDGGPKEIPSTILPIIAIPTTAGTGSEVGRSAVISEDNTGIKHIIFSPSLLPKLVLADPEVTLGLPHHITAATGMDALTHNIEAYLAKDFHPICDGIALEGTRLVMENLETAVKDGKNMKAREGMLMGAMMGAVAFQKGLGATHSMAHPLTTVANVPHGLANALCLARVLEFNKEVVEKRLATLATHLGLKDKSADGFIASIRKLTDAIGIPKRLRDVGIKEEMMPRLVELAVQDGCHQCNPRSVTKADFERMYRELL